MPREGVAMRVRAPRLNLPFALVVACALLAPAGRADAPDKGPKVFEALKYRAIGPAAGGRVARVAGVAGDRNTYYLASAGGGVWKSSDAGHSWKAILDGQPVSSIG